MKSIKNPGGGFHGRCRFTTRRRIANSGSWKRVPDCGFQWQLSLICQWIPATAGDIGRAEAEASTSVLADIRREWANFGKSLLAIEANIDFETLFRLKDGGDVVTREVLQRCIGVWSALTVSLIHAYGPELVLFGGAVMRSGEEIFDPVRGWVARHIWRATRGIPRIETTALAMMALCFEQKLCLRGIRSDLRIELR